MSKIASIVLSNTTREFDREYSYEIPERLLAGVVPGVRVIVPFGRGDRLREGYVLSVGEEKVNKELKHIDTVIDKVPVLSEAMLKLADWMRRRYICTYSDVIRCMLPPGIGMESTRMVRLLKAVDAHAASCSQEGNKSKIIQILTNYGGEIEFGQLKAITEIDNLTQYLNGLQQEGILEVTETFSPKVKQKNIRAASLSITPEEAIDEIESGRIRKIQQIRVLEILLDNEFIAVSDLARFAGVTVSVLNTLRKNGLIEYRDIKVNRDPLKKSQVVRLDPPEPTPQQADALKRIGEMMNSEGWHETVLHGITGSGKTEVYLRLMQQALDMGKQALMLVPEISLTPQAVERLQSRFGDEVAVLHSRLSLGERYDQWRLIKEGRKRIVVGARSAVFAPLQKPGIIIIDEEHESSYKSETTPRYHASDIARLRCQTENAILLYGSATPSIETYYKAVSGQIDLIELTERANSAQLPTVELVDMRKELESGNRAVFSDKLSAELQKNLQTGRQTMLFLNRRGYSSFVMCRSCGYTLKCTNCSLAMTYHTIGERLICHYCGYTGKPPKTCPKCGSQHIRHFGTGTQKIEEDLKKQFPDCSVIRMDMDTTGYKNSHETILRTFREDNINVMVGTQMIAKGHDFPNVTLVGVMAADSMLNIDDFRASERTFQLLTQVAGRAGRGEARGKVIIQTYNTDDFSILAACKHDYKDFYMQEIALRQKLGFPPFTNIGVILLSGTDDRNTFIAAKEVKSILEGHVNQQNYITQILGPARTPIPKIRGKYRWRLVIKSDSLEKLIDSFTHVSGSFYGRKPAEIKSIELTMDINPLSML